MAQEAVLVTIFLAVILLAQLALSRSFGLFGRNLWLDEIVSDLLVSDGSVVHSLRALAAGLDTNPPAYHLLLRGFRIVVGRTGEVTLRSFSALAVLAGLVGLYLNLRGLYPPLTAVAAVLAIWSHPLLMGRAFEARMYGPWFASIVWFAYLLGLSWNAPAESSVRVVLACSGLLACALHTLGTLALGLVLSGHLLSHQFARWDWLTIGSASLGPIGFLAWLPILWKQNDANPVTWVDAPTRRNVVNLAQSLLFPNLTATVLLISGGLSVFVKASSSSFDSGGAAPSAHLATAAGLASLLMMPVGLVVLSYAVQPILVPRYGLPTVASFAPAVAAVISPLPTFMTAGLCGLLFLIGATRLSNLRLAYRTKDRETADLSRAILDHSGHEPVLFETIHELSVLSRYAQHAARRGLVMDFETRQLGGMDDFRIASRNQARLLATFYRGYPMIPWDSVRMLPKFYLVPSVVQARARCSDLELQYQGFKAVELRAGLYEMIRS